MGGTVAKHLTRVLQSSWTPRNRLWLACESCDRGFAFFGPGEGHVEPAATRLLTTERLARYVRLGGSSEAGWDPYVWNAQIGSAYPLSWVEVGLCNASAQQMDQLRRRTDPAGEWLDPTNPWFNPWFQQGTVSSSKHARSRVSQPNQHTQTVEDSSLTNSKRL